MAQLKQTMNFKITTDLHLWYQQEAERQGVSMTSLMVNALNNYKDTEELKVAFKYGNLNNMLKELNEQISIAIKPEK